MIDTPYILATTETNTITPLVARVLDIEDFTIGSSKEKYLYRYRGCLRLDSLQAYDQLAAALRPLKITPLFRLEEGKHVVLLVEGTIDPRPSNPWINLLLFLLTVFSVLFAGALNSYTGPVPDDIGGLFTIILSALGSGIPFTISILSILLAHEFGHYLAGRFHHTAVTLPYFIPFPLSIFGTLGAFIQLKEPPKNKRVLLDIGLAGPLAGLAVAIPVLLLGLSLSEIHRLEAVPGQGFQLEGNSLLYLLSKFLVFGQLLPSPETYGGVSPLLYWVRYFFTGQPLPMGGLDVMLHPVAWAGWAGLLVTALNLIPAGQLDGGHAIYVLVGRGARRLLPFILVSLMLGGLVWNGWWLWALLIYFLGRIYAEPLDQITPLDPPRKGIAVLGLVIFLLVFTPVPLINVFF